VSPHSKLGRESLKRGLGQSGVSRGRDGKFGAPPLGVVGFGGGDSGNQ